MSRTLVIGANGTVGSELVRLLRAAGHNVLKATSRPVTDPATEVHLNLVTRTGLDTALQGVSKVFMLSPPGHTNQDELLNPVVDAAKAHGVQKIVLMTAMGANADENAPMRKAEVHLQHSGLAYNIIRPNWFMQNFNSFWIHGILEHGKIFLPVGAAKGSFIDARDISAVAARLLSTDDFNQRDFDLTGAVRQLASLREQDIVPTPSPVAPFGACADVFLNGKKIGVVGQLTPAVAREIGASTPLLCAEFDLELWRAAVSTKTQVAALAKFPGSTRDIAFVAPLDLAFGKVRSLIESLKEPLLESIRLFDLFTDPKGEKIPSDKKSMAISLTFRSPERTLTAEEIQAAADRVKAALRDSLSVDFRE